MSAKPSSALPVDLQALQQQVSQLTEQVEQLQAAELRSRADYQNLLRRTQEDKLRWIKIANADLVMQLLEPIDHLSLAAAQLQDKGLQLAIDQLWRVLSANGVAEINPLNQVFDVKLMEAVDTQGEGKQVKSVVKKGYTLNGQVLQHAKVIVG